MKLFKDFDLRPEILQSLEDLGFEAPTQIQEEAIPAILSDKRDVIALAQTGTGKTAAFGLPLIQMLDQNSKDLQVIILCPTRELCIQIFNDLKSFSKHDRNMKIAPVYGGSSISDQIKAIKKNPQIVVGTPGRVIDLMNRGVLKLSGIRWLVLDEADEMLNMGFKEDLTRVFADSPDSKQTFLFSATMPQGIKQITGQYMNKPLEISVGKRNSGAENIEHKFFVVHAKDRYKALRRIIDVNPGIYGIIFCRTRHETKDLANKLMQEGYNVDALHGDLSQSQRDYAMQRFRLKNLNLLIATDVAARGIDVSELTHVINYNLPDDPEVYIHRTGRTGRAGKKGVAYSILHSRETGRIKDIERLVGKSFDREMVPDGRMICERHLFDMIDRVGHEVPTDDQVEQYMEIIYDRLEWLDKKELIKRFVSVEFNRFFKEYSDAPDLNVNLKKLENDNYLGKNAGKNSQKGFDRYFINLGEKDKLKPVDIIGLVNQSLKERKIKVGRIDIMKKFAFFELEKGFADKIPPKMSRLNYHGTPISCQVAKPDGKSAKRTSSGKSQRKKSKKARR